MPWETQKVHQLVGLSANGLIGDEFAESARGGTPGTYQAFEMLHEYLQANIIRKDGLSSTASLTCAIHSSRHVCRRRIQF